MQQCYMMHGMNLRTYLDKNSNAEFARAINCPPAFVSQWKNNRRPVPLEYMAVIEQATGGKVTRKDLRPDDWHLIWPELARKKAA